jgi:redox-sensitive bicupin YhaK (pirin superfamily)
LQIWIEPNVRGIEPGYEQKSFADADKSGRLKLVASQDGASGAVTLHADAALYAGLLDADDVVHLPLDPARKAYVHLVRGALRVNGEALKAGDAMALAHEAVLKLDGADEAEVLVFDLAA